MGCDVIRADDDNKIGVRRNRSRIRVAYVALALRKPDLFQGMEIKKRGGLGLDLMESSTGRLKLFSLVKHVPAVAFRIWMARY